MELACTLKRMGDHGVQKARLITPQEVADMHGCTNVTVLRHIAAGRLHAIKVGGSSTKPRVYAILLSDAKRWSPGRRENTD